MGSDAVVVVVVVDYEDKVGRQLGWSESGGMWFVVVEEGIVADEEIGGATVVRFVAVGVDGRVVVVESGGGGGGDEDEGDEEEDGVKKRKKKKPRKEPGCNLVSEKKKLTAYNVGPFAGTASAAAAAVGVVGSGNGMLLPLLPLVVAVVVVLAE